MAVEFVHLHVHSQYSMLDGALKVKDLPVRVAALGMKAVAVTDHGNMFGALSFYKAAKAAQIQPIVGCELEIAKDGSNLHLPLLAQSPEGYKNLVWLVSQGHILPDPSGVEGLPCIGINTLDGHTKGLVALTGCMGGYVPQAVLEHGEQAGIDALTRLRDLFEPGNLYVELQDHGLVEQQVLNKILADLAQRLDLPLVATNDVHYPARTDAEAHLFLSRINTGRSYEEAKEQHHGSSEMYLKSPQEMADRFAAFPSAITNTLAIAEKCALKLKLGEPMLPSFPVPQGLDTEGYFRHIARSGLDSRFSDFDKISKQVDRDSYRARLEIELDVISAMKFPGYFLIVWDFIRYAKEQRIPVGPGRGSGAGSLIAYVLGITDLDPLQHDLLFERFLNPERVSMPDFDVDFCTEGRDRVIDYVAHKYGRERVSQIITYGSMAAKAVVRNAGRVLGHNYGFVDRIAKLIPFELEMTLEKALEKEEELRKLYESDDDVRELIDLARSLEGLVSNAGMHAGGVVIAPSVLTDFAPLFVEEGGTSVVTQFDKDDVEAAGLVKFDFLGLRTLTVIALAVRIINEARAQSGEQPLDMAKMPPSSLGAKTF